jgi:CRP-like cAMP-binding protein
MQTVPSLESNLLLATLPGAALDRLRPAMTIREYRVAERIFETGATPDVLFPLDGIVSLIQELEDGNAVEVSMVGAEGMAGFSGLLGVAASPHTGLTQGRGLFAVCAVQAMRELFDSDAAARDVILRWTHVALAQMAQTAVCNRAHEATMRLAHWFLLIHDRAATDEISVTHEFLALMLGARRATITEAMNALSGSGSIVAARGRVRIVNRRLLETQSCECYAAAVGHYEVAFGFAPRATTRSTEVD